MTAAPHDTSMLGAAAHPVGRAPAGVAFATMYTITVFCNAVMLFSVEPMFAKLALPLLGGTPSVWNTALVFFQFALLVGYAYAHVTTRLLRARQQLALHIGLLAASCLVLPLRLHLTGDPPVGEAAIPWLVLVLTVSLGLPFAVLASGAPLLQRWFAGSSHVDRSNPYFLYAASNLGSLCALLSYPLLIEPMLTLATQRSAWSIGYVLVMGLVGLCAFWGFRQRAHDAGHARGGVDLPAVRASVTARDRARWVLYAAVPSSLLLGATTYVSTDVAAFPLLWVIPLALYLLTFVLAFASRPPLPHRWMVKAEPYLLILAALQFFWPTSLPALGLAAFHFGLLFLVSMVCHGELARRRPSAALVTEFFLWISVGGLIGGVFNAVAAPVLFSSVVEYPLVLALAGFLRPSIFGEARPVDGSRRERILDALVPVGLAVILLASAALTPVGAGPSRTRMVFALMAAMAAAVVLLAAANRPLRFGLAFCAMFLAGQLRPLVLRERSNLRAERSFFGIYRVLDPAGQSVRQLIHGTTVHGAQSLDPARRLEPLTYYHRAGPMGDLFSLVPVATAIERRVAVVGLGVGSLACYGRTGERWTFYEIDPVVLDIARDQRLFTFLRDCPARVDVVLGDARLTLRHAAPASYDVLVLDAFSSDAIPVHLLTQEAFAVYDRVLAPHGVLAVHISNRHLDLEPIVSAIAERAGWVARVRRDVAISPEQRAAGRTGAVWILIARDPAALGSITTNAGWAELRSGGAVWTDDFSNVLRVLR